MYFVQVNGTHLAHVEGHLPDDADHAPQDRANVGELKIYLDITYLSTATWFKVIQSSSHVDTTSQMPPPLTYLIYWFELNI